MPASIRHRRLRNQRLTGSPLKGPAEVVAWLGAVQAQEYAAAKWGLAQRSRATNDAAIDVLLADGAIVRTHLMRPTWHFAARDDVRWMLALTGPRVHQANAGRYRDLGLDAKTLARGNDVLARALEGGRQMTRREAAAALEGAGVSTAAQRMPYLLMHAELDAVICSGALSGKQQTYALFDERVPPSPPRPRDEMLAELARRYFVSHGPALPQDFAWWSGLTLGDARRGIDMNAKTLEPLEADGRVYWHGGGSAKAPGAATARLLPVYDEYLIAYRHRTDYLDPAGFVRPPPPTAFNRHIVGLDGYVAGGWDRTLTRDGVTVEATLYVSAGQTGTRGDRRSGGGVCRFPRIEADARDPLRPNAGLGRSSAPVVLSWSRVTERDGRRRQMQERREEILNALRFDLRDAAAGPDAKGVRRSSIRPMILLAALLGLFLSAPAWAGPEEELQAMRAEAIAIPGAVVTEYPDFTIVVEPSGLAIRYFTKPSHYAHPAVVHRAFVLEEDGFWAIRYNAVYYGEADTPPETFLRWMAEFEELDRQMREHIMDNRSMAPAGASPPP